MTCAAAETQAFGTEPTSRTRFIKSASIPAARRPAGGAIDQIRVVINPQMARALGIDVPPGVQLFGRAKYKNRNRHGNPDANTKPCPDSNANANVSHRCTDTCTKYNTNEYAQRQSSYAPA